MHAESGANFLFFGFVIELVTCGISEVLGKVHCNSHTYYSGFEMVEISE